MNIGNYGRQIDFKGAKAKERAAAFNNSFDYEGYLRSKLQEHEDRLKTVEDVKRQMEESNGTYGQKKKPSKLAPVAASLALATLVSGGATYAANQTNNAKADEALYAKNHANAETTSQDLLEGMGLEEGDNTEFIKEMQKAEKEEARREATEKKQEAIRTKREAEMAEAETEAKAAETEAKAAETEAETAKETEAVTEAETAEDTTAETEAVTEAEEQAGITEQTAPESEQITKTEAIQETISPPPQLRY